MKKRFAMTLMEIMIVIFIITTIVGVLGVNMKGSMEKGKAFKSAQGSRQIYEILTMEYAQGNCTLEQIRNKDEVVRIIENSGLVRKADQLMRDGWGSEYEITCNNEDIRVHSTKYDEYARKKNIELESFMQPLKQ
ncbi:MAG: type II secretion system protein [Candidatus Algichlamydia australiensis]|nr:type II secretion system protein [Chlamydiales bacterium]